MYKALFSKTILAAALFAVAGFGNSVYAQTPEFTISGSQNEITGLYSLYAPTLLDANTMLIGGWKSSTDRTNFAAWRNSFRTWLSPIVNSGESTNLTQDWPWQTSRATYVSQQGNPPAAVVGPDKVFRTTRSGTWSNNPSLVFERVGDHVNDGDVVSVGNKKYMFYTSLSNEAVAISVALNNFQHSFTKHEVGLAESTNNGSSWTDRGIVIARGDSGDGQGAWAPSAIVEGNEIWVYYHTGTTNFSSPIVFRQKFNKNSLNKIGSPQRLSFTDDAGLLANVDVAKVGSTYVLAGNLLGRASLDTLSMYYSTNGTSFSKLPDSADGTNVLVQRSSGVAVTPEIFPSSSSAKIYYGQGSGAADGFNTIRSLDISIENAVQETGGGSCTPRSFGNNVEKNVTGYAWSSTIGWVSMSCENEGTCGTSDYGLAVANNGEIDGYAWSSNVGWISFFGEDTVGCPSGNCQASFNKSTGEITGWARALAPMCGASAAQAGNWDGWVYLGQSTQVGVDVNGCAWEGYAWGGGENTLNGTIGWLSFNGPGYSVLGSGDACAAGDPDLTAGTVEVEKGNNDATATFTFPISNIGGGNISGGVDAWIQIAYDSDHSAEFDENIAVNNAVSGLPGGTTKEGEYTLNNPRSGRHQVRVCADLPDNEITETNEDNNCGPVTTFQIDNSGTGGGLSFNCSASPTSASVGQNVTWSVTGLTGNVGVTTYSWSGTDNLSGTGSSVTKQYGTTGNKTAQLTVTAENASRTVSCTGGVGGGGVTVTDPPTAGISINPTRILQNESTQVTWTSTGASSCTGFGFNTGGAISGTTNSIVFAESGNKVIRVECGTASAERTLQVLAPNITITANGAEDSIRVSKNDVVTIAWTAEDVDSCDVRGGNLVLNGLTGGDLDSSADTTVTARSTYTISCTASGRAVDPQTVVVNIPPDFEEF